MHLFAAYIVNDSKYKWGIHMSVLHLHCEFSPRGTKRMKVHNVLDVNFNGGGWNGGGGVRTAPWGVLKSYRPHFYITNYFLFFLFTCAKKLHFPVEHSKVSVRLNLLFLRLLVSPS